jgi:glutamate-1-semialdehyde 2,1-aminomutase
MPGGVNSPVRRYSPYPLFVASAKGPRFTSSDGEEFLDYCMGYGALLDGHAPAEIIDSVKLVLDKGTVYGQPTEIEVELAELITKLVPSVEILRLSNTGTEATMHAIRLTRGFTGRKFIVKFDGCFHGSYDNVLVKPDPSQIPLAAPSSAGVLEDTAHYTLVASYNDLANVENIVREYSDEIAAVIVEPVMGNVGLVPPQEGFLQGVRKITRDNQILLIFDEVITGFRLAPGGAQQYFNIKPDLTIFGKIIGGGFPLSAFGGRREIMEKLAPLGPVYQAGTFNGNPVSVAAGLTMLRSIKKRGMQLYSTLERKTMELCKGIWESLSDNNESVQVNSVGSMFQIFFTEQSVVDYVSAKTSDVESYQHYFQALLKQHVFVPPSQFETCFLSTVHTESDISITLEAMNSIFKIRNT